MTPFELITWAAAIGVAAIIVASLFGLAYVVYTTAVQAAHKNEVKK